MIEDLLREIMLSKEAAQIRSRLSGQVVEIEAMTNSVNTSEEYAPPGSVLVETDHRIERNVAVDGRFPQPGRDVTTS